MTVQPPDMKETMVPYPPLAQMRLRLPNIFEKDTTPVPYSAGSVIFSEGQKRDRMYVVKAGEVYLLVRGQLGETVSVDGFFGELAMIDNSPRTATAVAQNRLYTNPHQRETIPVSSSRGSALRPRYHALDGPQNPTANRTIRRDTMAWSGFCCLRRFQAR